MSADPELHGRLARRAGVALVAAGALLALGVIGPIVAAMSAGAQELNEGRLYEARAEFDRSIRASGGHPAVLGTEIGWYAAAGRTGELMAWADRIRADLPGPDGRFWAGFAELRANRLDAACVDLAAAAAAKPGEPVTVNAYAYSCLVEPGRDLDRAIVMLQRAVRDSRREGDIVDSLGWAYIQRYRQRHRPEDLRAGTADLEEAVATTASGPADPFHALAVLFGVAQASDGPQPEVCDHLVAAYSAQASPAGVRRILADHPAVQACLGAAWARRAAPAHAGGSRVRPDPSLGRGISALEDSVTADPNDAWARMRLGEAYAAAGRRAEAYVELQKAAWLDPGLAAAATALAKLGRPA